MCVHILSLPGFSGIIFLAEFALSFEINTKYIKSATVVQHL